MVEKTKNEKRKWQNLLYLKCPNCNCVLQDAKQFLSCPTPHETEPGKSCFFIKKEKLAELLLDENHPANFCLNAEERSTIETMIETQLSLKVTDDAGMV